MSKLIIANWKANKSIKEASIWINLYSQTVTRQTSNVVLCPSFPLLSVAEDEIKKTGTQLLLGVQTLSPYPAGSYTGGVSVKNLEGLPIRYAILGHSERRQYFHETNNDVAKQVDQALSAGITPIVCVDKDYITSQAAAIADEVKPKCIVAYEPASAIGSGNAEDPNQVTQIVQRIKLEFTESKILYGGSVHANNITEYTSIVDGFVIGSASLEVSSFIALLEKI